MRRLSVVLVLVLALGVLAMAGAWAQSVTPPAAGAQTIRTVLAERIAKPVTLQLDSGQELTGVVRSVGERVVQLERLSGREFYDAYVDLDEVAAVIVRAR